MLAPIIIQAGIVALLFFIREFTRQTDRAVQVASAAEDLESIEKWMRFASMSGNENLAKYAMKAQFRMQLALLS